MTQKKKICICSDSIQNISGMGKVSLRVAKGFFHYGYDVSYFVITGQDSDRSCSSLYGEQYKDLFDSMTICNCQVHDRAKIKLFDDFIYQEKPDIVFTLLDPWYLDQIEMSTYRDSFYWVAWCLFETPEYPEYIKQPNFLNPVAPAKSLFDPLRKADLCIPVSKMGKKILEDHKVKTTDNVYLGIDFDLRCSEELTKRQVFGDAVQDDSFIFMTVGRNSERKKIDKSIEAFAQFLKSHRSDRDKYKLYVHSNHLESASGTDLITLAIDLGVINNVLFPTCFQNNEIMLDRDLYKRYKVCDAYIGLPAGEGFGYGFIEALMHDKPVIYLNYGAHKEYCLNHGYSVGVSDYYNARDVHMKWALPKIDEAVKHMLICTDSKHKIDSSEFVKNNFDWRNVILPELISIVESNLVVKPKIPFKVKRVV